MTAFPETPESALADVISDIRHLYGFDYTFGDDRMAEDIIKRLAEHGDGYTIVANPEP